ncbi:MAG: hypothetical protein WBM98_13200, partial [Maribacter sp.]
MKRLLLIGICFIIQFTVAQEKVEILPEDIQIRTAVLPAPEEDKAGAMVYGYNEKGEFAVLREGTNNLVCIGDDPAKEGISVSCYSKKLEPFMAR